MKTKIFFFFCLLMLMMMYLQNNNLSRSGRPKNIRLLQIRIHYTDKNEIEIDETDNSLPRYTCFSCIQFSCLEKYL
jgi:hypothetical protein